MNVTATDFATVNVPGVIISSHIDLYTHGLCPFAGIKELLFIQVF